MRIIKRGFIQDYLKHRPKGEIATMKEMAKMKDIAMQLNCKICTGTKMKQQSINNNKDNCKKSFWKSQR